MDRHILIVEDDEDMREVVSHFLRAGGFRVTALDRGQQVVSSLRNGGIDLILLDLTLPDADGLAITREVRASHKVGIIILSGRTDTIDRVVGLEGGADDYICKPFESHELLARIRNVLRRVDERRAPMPAQPVHRIYRFGRWILDGRALTLKTQDGTVISLTSGEFTLLLVLVEHANKILSRTQLIELTSESDSPAHDRSIDSRIVRLRRKLEFDPKEPQILKTVRNRGYVLTAEVEPV